MPLTAPQLTFIASIKEKIRLAQYEALKEVNIQLIKLYWEIGKGISERQKESWGKSIVTALSKELQKDFPGISGFSERNLWLMAQFYNEYHEVEFLQPVVAEISWAKHIAIMGKCKDNQERRFYIMSTKKFGWSKNVLTHQIENKTYEKYLLGQTNFDLTLPANIKNQAALAVKDEYTFDFLDLADEHTERQLELALVNNVRSFLFEMGSQFTFIGNQYKLQVGKKEYFIDLLLYHRELKCLVAVELKIGEFQPEYKGKMEFYLSLLNDKIKLPMKMTLSASLFAKKKTALLLNTPSKQAPCQ
jgi:predicted nuclease of restriction endonuclease-like (RecB) superfamily